MSSVRGAPQCARRDRNGKRAITADTARRLGKYFGVSPEVWMGLQADYDLRIAQRIIGDEMDRRVPRHAV